MVQAHRLMKKVGQGNALLKISFMKVEALWRHSAPSAPPRPTAKNEYAHRAAPTSVLRARCASSARDARCPASAAMNVVAMVAAMYAAKIS